MSSKDPDTCRGKDFYRGLKLACARVPEGGPPSTLLENPIVKITMFWCLCVYVGVPLFLETTLCGIKTMLKELFEFELSVGFGDALTAE